MLPDRIEHDRLDQGRRAHSPLHRVSARAKLLAALALLVVTSVAQPWWWRIAPGVPFSAIHAIVLPVVAVLVWAARIRPHYLLARLLVFAVPLTLVALTIPLAQGRAGGAMMAGVITKGLLSFTIVLCLVYTTSFERLLQAMHQCGAPKVMVAVLASMHRFVFVLLDELERMRRAQYARTFDCPRRLSPITIRNGSRAVGMLLVRASDRAERVHAAMIARGFDGEIRMLEDDN